VFSVLVSCSESPNEPSATEPTIGSTYSFGEFTLDEHGDTLTTKHTLTDSLLAIDLTFFNATNVHLFASINDSAFIKPYENGPFEMFQDSITIMNGLGFPPIWITHDSKSTLDTVYHTTNPTVVNGFAGTLTLHITTKGNGTFTHSINGEMLTVENCESTITVEVALEGMGTVSTTTVTSKFSYAPKIRYFVREEIITYSDSPFSPVPNGREVRELVGYSLN
jgi:hypothetical protein